MSYIQFASIGGKILGQEVHPIFRVENEFPCSEIILVVSKEDNSDPMTLETQQNVKEIRSIYQKRGIPTRIMPLTIEDFWHNVATLAVEILKLPPSKAVLLNFSTGRRVLVSTMLLAGSFALSWDPDRNITCVQTSRNYPTAVVFEPIPPVIPDMTDKTILSSINDNNRITTTEIAEPLGKGQSTISVRIKKLVQAGFIETSGHSKNVLPKGQAILGALTTLADLNLLKG